MANKIDMDKKAVDKDGNATAYLEDIISQIVDDLGGESGFSVANQIMLYQAQNFALLAQIKASR